MKQYVDDSGVLLSEEHNKYQNDYVAYRLKTAHEDRDQWMKFSMDAFKILESSNPEDKNRTILLMGIDSIRGYVAAIDEWIAVLTSSANINYIDKCAWKMCGKLRKEMNSFNKKVSEFYELQRS